MISEIRLADDLERAAMRDTALAAPASLGLTTVELGGATVMACAALPITLFNRALGATAAGVDAIVAHYRAAGVRTCWIHLGAADDPALRDALAAAGFAPAKRRAWAKMLRDTAPPPVIATDLAIDEVSHDDMTTRDALGAALAEAFGMPAITAPWIAAIAARPAWRAYAARDGARVVGGGLTFVAGAAAWLGFGAVLPAFRRRGGQGALMTRRIADAIAAGCTVLATETGEPVGDEANPSLANMRRCGFTQVASRENFERRLD